MTLYCLHTGTVLPAAGAEHSRSRGPWLKRKRSTSLAPSCPCTRSTSGTSPKRPRRDSDLEVVPTHSISAAGAASTASALEPNERNTFSVRGSQASHRPTKSPSRDNIAVLAYASPPTITESSSGLKEPPPPRVQKVMERLENGLDRGRIPSELQKLIEGDPDFGYQRIERHAWGESTARSPSESGVGGDEDDRLAYVLRKVKGIWLNARVCQLGGRDENAWCVDVIQPLIQLAMRLQGDGKFWLQSVQAQAIATEFLSSVPDASAKSRLLDRKADFTLSFSHMPSPGFENLYSRPRIADNHLVSHTADAFTKTTALFSGVEVKSASGDHTEAEYQLSIWTAASLRKKMQLARLVGQVEKSNLVEPCFAIVGHETHVYFAYMALEERDAVHILGPEAGVLGLCETRSVSGIFRALRLWRNVIMYGRDVGSERFDVAETCWRSLIGEWKEYDVNWTYLHRKLGLRLQDHVRDLLQKAHLAFIRQAGKLRGHQQCSEYPGHLGELYRHQAAAPAF